MPVSLAHPAAILPVYAVGRRRLRASALVVGSVVPDFAYLVRDGGYWTHSAGSLFWFSLPVGLLSLVWLEVLIRPAVALALPAAQREFPRSASEWIGMGVAILLGAATHLLWDGFVHPWMWPADVLYPDLSRQAFSSLHWLSSLIGMTTLVVYLATRYRPGGLRIADPRLLATMFGLAAAGAGVAYTASSALARTVLSASWSAALGAALGLTLACLLPRGRATSASEQGAAGAGSAPVEGAPAAPRAE